MKWIKGDYRNLPIIATVGNSYCAKPSVYSLVDDGIIWADIVKITKTIGNFRFGVGEGKNYYWRVVYVENGKYKTKEFRYLRDAKKYVEEIIKKRFYEKEVVL